jgi:hypothetical protein
VATLFLELDDEITSAVGRLRAASDPSVALVLPAGSRIASSRINFRLLAREAEQLGTQLSIVSPEATARALASAAGLPTFGTVNRYEAAMAAGIVAAGEGAGEGIAEVGGGGSPGAAFGPPQDADSAAQGTAAGGAGSSLLEAARRDLPVAHRRRRFVLPSVRGGAIVAALVILALLGGGTVAGAYFILPEARITVTPRVEALGPLVFQVTADPEVTTSDPAGGVVPATWLETTVDAQQARAATGRKVTETKATGTVNFSNRDIDGTQSVPSGATVKTKSGIAFVTAKAVTVPKATVQQDPNGMLILVPGTASVGVAAAKAGTSGNVAAATITVVPQGYNPNLLRVTNGRATTGGTHTETKVIRQSDYDAAVAAAQEALQQSFDQWVSAPTGAAAGAIVVAESAVLDDATLDPAADQVVGKEMDTFDLTASADGRVVTVDPAVLTAAGEARFRASEIPAGSVLIDSSLRVTNIQVESDDPAKPMFEITANGQGYRQLDAAALEALVLGKSVDEARAILRPYGDPVVALNPDWFGTIPQLDWRVSVEVVPPAGVS